jgi:hypothetical protein
MQPPDWRTETLETLATKRTLRGIIHD